MSNSYCFGFHTFDSLVNISEANNLPGSIYVDIYILSKYTQKNAILNYFPPQNTKTEAE